MSKSHKKLAKIKLNFFRRLEILLFLVWIGIQFRIVDAAIFSGNILIHVAKIFLRECPSLWEINEIVTISFLLIIEADLGTTQFKLLSD